MPDKPTAFRYTPAQRRALVAASGAAANLLVYGGSRSGKTFALACALVVRALKSPGSRHAIIRRHYNTVHASIGLDTLPKVMKLRFPGVDYEYRRTDGIFRFANTSEIHLIGLDDELRAEKILGQEFSTLYFNECSELEYKSVQMALTRLAQNSPGIVNKAFYDCNPPGRRHWTYRVFIEKVDPVDRTALRRPESYQALRINPDDNRENLPASYLAETLANLPERQKRRFLLGEWSDDTEGALWTEEMIDRERVLRAPDDLARIVIGVDPAVTSNSTSDHTGIVAAAIGPDGRYYILKDASCRTSPLEWAKLVTELYHELDADLVVGEVNNGGDLIESLLRQFSPDIAFHAVRASRGKILRAEPAAALYERRKVCHVGRFPDLEEQMLSYSPLHSANSPDRLDALVWVLAELAKPAGNFILA